MTRNKFTNLTKVLVLALVMSVGIQYVVAQTWAPPSAPPAQGNAYSPLNVGAGVNGAGQSKAAGLTIGTSVASPSPALIVPTGRVSIGAGLSPSARLDVKGDVEIDLTSEIGPGEAGRNAIKILANSANTYGSILINKPGLAFWNTIGGVRANILVNDLDANGTVRIAGGSPATGKVLTATDAVGNATWQAPAGGSIVAHADGVVPNGTILGGSDGYRPAGFTNNQCSFMVSPTVVGSSARALGIVTSSLSGDNKTVNCTYVLDGDNQPPVETSCNYMIVCSR